MSQLEVHRDRLAVVGRVGREAADAASVPEAIGMLIGEMTTLLQADGVGVDLLRGDNLTTCYATGAARLDIGRSRSIEHPVLGPCLRTSLPLRSPNVRRDPRFQPPPVDMDNVVSMISVPLYVHGPAVGVIRVFSSTESHFDDKDLMLARLLTGSIGRVLIDAVRREADHQRGGASTAVSGPADFETRREAQVRHAQHYGYAVTLVVWRIEGYLTRAILEQMASLVRKTDDCFRLDAGEFVILMPGTTVEEANTAASRIKRGIENSAGEGSGVRLRWEASVLVAAQASLA